MDFDAYAPSDTERLLKAGTTRPRLRDRRVLTTEAAAAGLLALACLALGVLGAPYHHINAAMLVVMMGVYLVCQEVDFPIGPVYTFPTQLAFVPMLLVVPLSLVPAVVVVCRLISLLRPERRRRTTPMYVLVQIADGSYALGPVLVLLGFHQHSFAWSHWPIYAVAMAAQILVDLGTGLVRSWMAERTPPREFVPILGWLYATDVCLTCVGLFVVASAQQHPGLVLLVLPLVGLLALFARERKERMQSSVELSSTYRGTATLLGDVLEEEDAYTGIHSREVADLSYTVALALDLTATQLFNVEYGALLHDIGKIRVPKAILQKQGKLTTEEWKLMREHTVVGEEMLAMIGGGLSTVGRIVRHSHEHFDGTGYPDGLRAEEIPIESRIISACDAWNAMTTSRPYRRALSTEVAADEMKRCTATQFDPRVIDALLREVAGPPYCEGVMEAARLNGYRASARFV